MEEEEMVDSGTADNPIGASMELNEQIMSEEPEPQKYSLDYQELIGSTTSSGVDDKNQPMDESTEVSLAEIPVSNNAIMGGTGVGNEVKMTTLLPEQDQMEREDDDDISSKQKELGSNRINLLNFVAEALNPNPVDLSVFLDQKEQNEDDKREDDDSKRDIEGNEDGPDKHVEPLDNEQIEAELVEGEIKMDEDENCANNDSESPYYFWPYQVPSNFSPKYLVKSSDFEFSKADEGKKIARYTKGCKWAPDGSCLISSSDDDKLRLFNFPSSFSSITDWTTENENFETTVWNSELGIKEGGLIYDYCWYPLMSSMDPVSSCFISTSSEAPIHLWDAFSGKLRASYTPYNHLDQVISAYSIAFDSTGQNIYSGFEKSIRVFNIARPGRECVLRPLKQSLQELNQYGIVASIAVNPQMSSFYAVGSFDKSIGLYYEDGSVICLLQGHVGGITHMKFSSDGMKLFTGGRTDSRLFCWDMRQMGEAYKIYERVVSTHQRIYFDLTPNDRYLVSGGTDGVVKIWDLLSEELEPCCSFRSNTDCVNGVSVNPYIPILATSSGQRHFMEIIEDSDDEELFTKPRSSLERSCDIKLWKLA